jgi:hypothetical protein
MRKVSLSTLEQKPHKGESTLLPSFQIHGHPKIPKWIPLRVQQRSKVCLMWFSRFDFFLSLLKPVNNLLPLQKYEFTKLKRRRQKSKNIWKTYEHQFEESGWDYLPLVKKFKSRFGIDPRLMQKIFTNANFDKYFPYSTILSKYDLVLAMFYKLNTGCEFGTLSDVFGGHENTHSSNFNKCVDAAVFFFRNSIVFPTHAECEKLKRRLHEENYPNPQAIFIADCIDTPIHSSNPDFYTPKKCCSSNHAIRNLVVVCRRTCEIIYASCVFEVDINKQIKTQLG